MSVGSLWVYPRLGQQGRLTWLGKARKSWGYWTGTRAQRPHPFPHAQQQRLRVSVILGPRNGLCFDVALRVPDVTTHCPRGPLDSFPGINHTSPYPSSPWEKGRTGYPLCLVDRKLAPEVKSQRGSHLCSTAKPGSEHRSSSVCLLLEKIWKAKMHEEENKNNQ